MIRKYVFTHNWKPIVRFHQFHRVFKNGLYGFKGGSEKGAWKIAKVRFLRKPRNTPLSFSMEKSQYGFGRDDGW